MARCGLRLAEATATLILPGARTPAQVPVPALRSWTQGGGPKDAQKTSGSGSYADHWRDDCGQVIQPKDEADDAALSEMLYKGKCENELVASVSSAPCELVLLLLRDGLSIRDPRVSLGR